MKLYKEAGKFYKQSEYIKWYSLTRHQQIINNTNRKSGRSFQIYYDREVQFTNLINTPKILK